MIRFLLCSAFLVTTVMMTAAPHRDQGLARLLAPLPPLPAAVTAETREREAREEATRRTSADEVRPTYVTAREVLPILVALLTSKYELGGELRLRFLRPWPRLRLPDEHWQVEISHFPPNGLDAQLLLPLRFTVDGEPVADLQMPVRAEHWLPVMVAARKLNRAEEIVAEDFTLRPLDALRQRQALVPADTDLDRFELARAVNAGDALSWRDLVPRPLIRKGQRVEVRLEQGFLRLSMQATALENGARGDRIRLRNLDSRQDLEGIIRDSQTVVIRH